MAAEKTLGSCVVYACTAQCYSPLEYPTLPHPPHSGSSILLPYYYLCSGRQPVVAHHAHRAACRGPLYWLSCITGDGTKSHTRWMSFSRWRKTT